MKTVSNRDRQEEASRGTSGQTCRLGLGGQERESPQRQRGRQMEQELEAERPRSGACVQVGEDVVAMVSEVSVAVAEGKTSMKPAGFDPQLEASTTADQLLVVLVAERQRRRQSSGVGHFGGQPPHLRQPVVLGGHCWRRHERWPVEQRRSATQAIRREAVATTGRSVAGRSRTTS